MSRYSSSVPMGARGIPGEEGELVHRGLCVDVFARMAATEPIGIAVNRGEQYSLRSGPGTTPSALPSDSNRFPIRHRGEHPRSR